MTYRLVISSIDLYLYYGEPHNGVTYGVTYEGPGKKLEIIQLKETAGDQFEEVEKENYERARFGLSVA